MSVDFCRLVCRDPSCRGSTSTRSTAKTAKMRHRRYGQKRTQLRTSLKRLVPPLRVHLQLCTAVTKEPITKSRHHRWLGTCRHFGWCGARSFPRFATATRLLRVTRKLVLLELFFCITAAVYAPESNLDFDSPWPTILAKPQACQCA
jgi:hypothetical protein